MVGVSLTHEADLFADICLSLSKEAFAAWVAVVMFVAAFLAGGGLVVRPCFTVLALLD